MATHSFVSRFSFLFFLTSFAGADPGVPAALTLSDALARAEREHPRLAALAYGERAAAGLIEQAGLAPNPELGLELENVIGTGALRGGRGLEATIQASQRFERGGKRDRRVTAAERERDAVRAELAIERAEVKRQTALAFVEVLAAVERVRLAMEALQLAREIEQAVTHRVQAGADSAAEAARGRAAVALAEAEVARAEARLAAARVTLSAQWGGSDGAVEVAGSLRLPEGTEAEAPAAVPFIPHPRLEHQRALIAAFRAALGLEEAEAVTDVRVGGGLRFAREGSDLGVVAGVSVPLPVRHRNQGRIRAARERLAGAEAMLHAVEAELAAEHHVARQERAAALAAGRRLREEVLPLAAEAHGVVRAGYSAGELPLLDVLEAQRQVIGLRREVLEFAAAYAAAQVRLDALADPTFAATAALLSP